MEDRKTVDLDAALLAWLSDVLDRKTVVDELSDGKLLWSALQAISAAYFRGSVPENAPADNWIRRWQNLKHVDKMITSFFRDELGKGLDGRSHVNIDLKAVANGVSTDALELVKRVLLAAIYAPNYNQKLIATMEKLGPTVAKIIAACVQDMIDPEHMSIQTPEHSNGLEDPFYSPTSASGERELEGSAPLSSARQFVSLPATLKQEQPSLMVGSEREDHLEADVLMRKDHNMSRMVRELHKLQQKDTEHIAELERELQEVKDRLTNESRRAVAMTKASEGARKQFSDEVESLRQERDDLASKVNTPERTGTPYRRSEMNSNDMASLRNEYDKALEELSRLRRLKARTDHLEKANRDSLDAIQSTEEQLVRETALRQQYEEEVMRLTSALESLQHHDDTRSRPSKDTEDEAEESGEELASALGALSDELNDHEFSHRPSSHRSRSSQLTRTESNTLSIHSAPLETNSETSSLASISDRAAKTNEAILQLIKEGRDALSQGDDRTERYSDDEDHPVTEDSHPPHTAQAQSQELIKRELRLMTSAWYNITKLIQSDAVIVQRRQQTPSSFLNRQRRLLRSSQLQTTRDPF